MKKIIELTSYAIAFSFLVMGQVFYWTNPLDAKIVPYLLTAIFLVLSAIYFKDNT